MKRWLLLIVLVITSGGCNAGATPPVRFGAVATVQPIATDAAMDVLRGGGNAVDAAVAAMLTLGVVDNHNSGIGGGCFIVIRMADGRTAAIDAREMAPAAAHRDMFLVNGKADPDLSQTGPLAVGIPGALKGYDLALHEFGSRPIADLILPASQLAERGFPIDGNYAGKLKRTRDTIAKFPGTRAQLLKADGSVYLEGETLVQPDLAKTYRGIASQGVDAYFYRGEFARTVGDWMQANGGIITADDFGRYVAKKRDPIVTRYRGRTIIGMPPPSSGGLHVAQILAMIERFDLSGLTTPERITVIGNAMSLAFADRAYWLGDPDFASVPRGLLDPTYLAQRSALIAADRALAVGARGTPPVLDPEFFERQSQKHTTHVSVADAQGNVCAITATVNTTFGSKVIVPGTGVVLNNEMDDFSAQPGVPNAFGLIGMEANAVAAGKRPLSSMSPTLVVSADGKPEIIIGAAGGPKIITQVVCVLVNSLDLKHNPKAAMELPRFHHQWRPDELWIEKSIGDEVLAELERRGFTLSRAAPSGATNMIVIQPDGSMIPVSEPRLTGKALVE
jgi:gamma-glutamyltranspeptidase / glutathione hydrolase